MATSPYKDTEYVLDFLGRLIWGKSATVLDVGAGFGRWGFLCRCHMGNGESLTANPSQNLKIDAIEAFSPNISLIYDCVYNATYKGDVVAVLPALGDYDIIICSHMIEHLSKEQALALIDRMRQKARMALILCLPWGHWPQDAIGGNDFEVHKSSWLPSDFSDGKALIKMFGRAPLSSGVVIFPISAEARWNVKNMKNPFRRLAFRWTPSVLWKFYRLLMNRGDIKEQE